MLCLQGALEPSKKVERVHCMQLALRLSAPPGGDVKTEVCPSMSYSTSEWHVHTAGSHKVPNSAP